MTIQERIAQDIYTALRKAQSEGDLAQDVVPRRAEVLTSAIDQFGDFSTSVAVECVDIFQRDSLYIAEQIKKYVGGEYAQVHVSQLGHIHFTLSDAQWHEAINDVEGAGAAYGSSVVGRNRQIVIESLAYHEIGNLSLSDMRRVYVGDVIARVFATLGYRVTNEYVCPDVGQHIDVLSESVMRKFLHSIGMNVPYTQELYPSSYVEELIACMDLSDLQRLPLNHIRAAKDDIKQKALQAVRTHMTDILQRTLHTQLDSWVWEHDVQSKAAKVQLQKKFDSNATLYEDADAFWLRTTEYGDEKDRVYAKKNSESATLEHSCILCWTRSVEKKVERTIFLLPASYHAYKKRILALPQLCGVKMKHDVLFVQSIVVDTDTRSGIQEKEYVLEAVVASLGSDTLRFLSIAQSLDRYAHLRLAYADSQSQRHPLYVYRSVYAELGLLIQKVDQEVEKISNPLHTFTATDKKLLSVLMRFPEVLKHSAQSYEVQNIVLFAKEIITVLDAWSQDNTDMLASKKLDMHYCRLFSCVRTTLAATFAILGVALDVRDSAAQ